MAIVTGPVGGNFANNQGGLRAKAMNSAINPAPLAKPAKPVNLVQRKVNGKGYPVSKPSGYQGVGDLKSKAAEFRQDEGPPNTNNQTPANMNNKTYRSQG